MTEPSQSPSSPPPDKPPAPPAADPTSSTGEDLLAALADDFAARARRGERPTVEEYVAKHPAHAERIRKIFPAIAMIEESRPADLTAAVGEGPGSTIGRYKLLERIGEGGFGVVYMAEQQLPVRRKVALKVLKPGMDSRQVLARFEAERQALAIMEHPNIAKVFDGGMTDSGRPYFVMELVKGSPITDFCDQRHLTPRQRLELFGQVCHAVQHAHQKGIIHRDIKPSNVLVIMHDTIPLVKVIDFGVAKALGQELTEKTLFTGFAQLVGTPLYMSPEQAGQSALDVDTRSDIYSLGVLLYELLTGTTPFDKERFKQAAQDEIRRIIREEEPPRPSTRLSESKERLPSISANRHTEPAKLTRLVRGELDWIVMKAMEKERNRRYETATGLARDIERYLQDESVEACPPSTSYRLHKFARRNRGTLVTASVIGLALLFVVGSFGWAVRDRTARKARVSAQLQLILQEVERLERAEKWDEALTQARRAGPALAAGEAATDIQNRARQVLSDLELVQRLERIREQSGAVFGRGITPLLARDAEQDYAGALRGAGIDIDTLPAKEAAERITARGQIAAALLPALDDWVAVRNRLRDEAAPRRLIDVLRIADPDPWRQRVRDCLARKDLSELENLARSADLDRQPAATLSFLSSAIRQQAEADTNRPGGAGSELVLRGFSLEIDVLRRAQWKYPADYWINRRLGTSLISLKSPPLVVQEGIGYLRTAVALRPRQSEAMWYMGHGYRFLGEPDQAIACYREAVEINQRRLGDEAYGLLSLAVQLRALDKFAEAEAVYRENLALYRKKTGKEAPRLLMDVALMLRYQGKLAEAKAVYREAEAAYREVLASQRKALGSEHRDVTGTLSALASLLRGQDRRAEAEALYREALAIRRKALGNEHPTVVTPLRDLASLLQSQGKLAEAEALYREALAIRRKALGNEHPTVVRSLSDLASLLQAQDKPAEAEALYREALAIRRKALGNEHPTVVRSLSDLASLLQAQDKPAEAEALYREALAIRRKILSDARPNVAYFLIRLAWVLEDQGKLTEAESAVRETLAINRRGLGNEDLEIHRNLLGIAYLLHAQDKLAEAEPLCREALTILRNAVKQKPNDPVALNALAWSLATCAVEQLRDPTQALELAIKAVQLRPSSGNTRNTLGVARYRAGEFKQAVADLETSMQLSNGGNGDDFFFLAMAHWRLGNEEEARKWYDRAVEWMQKNPNNWEALLFRAEAAQLLGIPQAQPATAPAASTSQNQKN